MSIDFDPFAEDETPAPKATTRKTTTKKETTNTVDETQASGITISHKPSASYDAALFVFKSGSPSEALDLYADEKLDELIRAAAETDQKIKRAFGEIAPAPAATPASAPTNPPERREAPNGEARYCQHGKMVFKSGTSASGRTWKGFFCPTPQGTPDQCKPEFLRG